MKRGAIRVAAAGDVHASEERRDEIAAAFASLDGAADLVLLAGDLTTHGEPDEAVPLAAACEQLRVPVVAVLGNHDWHRDRAAEIAAVLAEAGAYVLDPGWTVLGVDGTRVGVAGTKGFVGGFPDSAMTDFGEPSLRRVYRETTAEVEALDRGLAAIADCALRIALLHYSPTQTTLAGEPRGLWAFLGSDRLSRPIAEHTPELVVHGHAHAGTFEGYVGAVPVFNVAIPVMGKEFWIFELEGRDDGHV